MARGENRDIRAFPHHLRLPDDERFGLFGEVRYGWAAEAQIDGAVVFGRRDGRHLRLVVVAGVDNHHVGQHPHQSEVFHHLVRGAVFAHGDARMRRANLDVQVRVSHRHADLVVDAARDEACKTGGERNLAAQRETG